MSADGDFVDRTLRYEGDEYRADAARERYGDGLRYYGASVGAVRGTIRDLGRRHRGMTHDEATALSSELWAEPVFERRLAAIVLLQSHVTQLGNSDLTRIEAFLRDARLDVLADALIDDVLLPLVGRLTGTARQRANAVLARWARDENAWLRRGAHAAGIPKHEIPAQKSI